MTDSEMNGPVRSIVVLGGGSAGWITAGTLAASLAAASDGSASVTLIESPNVPIVGVGEGTWPTMRNTLKRMGVRETDFLRSCNVALKQGAKFAGWVTGAPDDFYYHPLVLPQGYFDINLVPHWLEEQGNRSFSSAVCPQEAVCEQGLAPKQITSPEYQGMLNYAYHLDAGAFAEFLRRHCIDNLGVRHVSDDVIGVVAAANGDIAALATAAHGEIAGDLFIDCSGSRALLIDGHFKVPFRSCRDILFIDRALALQVPYASDAAPVASHTISTAQEAGWIWDIGLTSRRGVGHVYSSRHTSDEEAEERLRSYLRPTAPDVDSMVPRRLSFDPGHRERFWQGNCVAVGLSAGFLEPLEASALLLVEIAAAAIAEQLPANRAAMDIVARRFNDTFRYRWDRIIDFLKLHYLLSVRTDSGFWIDNRDPATVPDSLGELLELWRHQPPWHDDFDRAVEVFPAASYQYVLYGMGFRTQANPRGLSERSREAARRQFERNRQEEARMLAALPTNRTLLDKVAAYGLQPV